MLVFMVLWSVLVYAPIAHWVWSPNGFLFGDGVLDFAGGTVVHINAGIAGLVCCLVLGKRIGYGNEPMAPHNLTLTLIGTSLLWVGWFGFNAGSALAADGRAGMAFAATHIGAASRRRRLDARRVGRQGQAAASWVSPRAPMAGLVAITPAGRVRAAQRRAGHRVGRRHRLLLGVRPALKNMIGYDNSLDVFGVHGVGGIVGALLTGVFAVSAVGGDAARGLLDGNPGQLWIQVSGILWTIGWCVVATFVLLKLIDLVMGLRVDRDTEREGLDLALHGESVA